MTILAKLNHINLKTGNRKLLHDVSLSVQSGRILTVIGPNGAGKSTLLRVLLGLMPADSGVVWKKPDLRIGYVPQHVHISPLLPITVDRFIRLGQSQQAWFETANHRKKSREQRLAVLKEMGIVDLRDQPLQALSGGEMQRVLLSRALLVEPELLVLDEPAQGVDVSGQSEVYQLIQQVRDARGCGVLLISHDLHLVMSASDQVICLNQHICCHGKPEKVSQHPEYLKLFGDLPIKNIAVYTHQHDHHHDMHGNILCGHASDESVETPAQSSRM